MGGPITRSSVCSDSSRPNPNISHNFDEFVSNGTFFNPQDGHRTIEIKELADGKFMLEESTLLEKDISIWLHQTAVINDNFQTRVRLLHLRPRGPFQAIVPLPLSSTTFQEIFTVLKIPQTFLRILLSNLPIALHFTPNTGQDPSGAECTTAVCIGLRSSEYEEFIHYAKDSIQPTRNCMNLPILFVDFMNYKTAQWLTEKRLRLQAISLSKEIRVREISDDYGFREDENMDLDTATRKLTRLSSEYGIIESIVKTHIRFLDIIGGILEERRKVICFGSTSVNVDGPDKLLGQIHLFQESFKSALQYVERDRHGIQSLTQTTYYLIAQKESQRNLMIAEVSKAIADESRKIAWWARRDSTDMRIITAITLIFLPGTFTATLFGSNLFNFNAAKGERMTALFSWIYWVVTALLTAIVLLTWILASKFKNRRQAKALHGEKEIKMPKFTQGEFIAAPGCGQHMSIPSRHEGSCSGGCGGCGGCGSG